MMDFDGLRSIRKRMDENPLEEWRKEDIKLMDNFIEESIRNSTGYISCIQLIGNILNDPIDTPRKKVKYISDAIYKMEEHRMQKRMKERKEADEKKLPN